MATQKKSGGSRTASGGGSSSRSTSGGGRTSSGRTSGGRTSSSRTPGNVKSRPPQKQPFRREAGAAVCLFLGLFSSLGYFNMKALFIDLFCDFLKGAIGYGFWLTPPALLLGAYILTFHRGRPVQLRLTCALLLPLVFSCLLHGLIIEPLPWDAKLFGILVESGKQLHSGGALGGMIGQGFVTLFTGLGAAVAFTMTLIFLGLGAFNRTIVDVADWVFNRPRYDYQPEPEPVRRRERPRPEPRREERREERERREEPRPEPRHFEEPPRPAPSRAAIDIPVDNLPGTPQPVPQATPSLPPAPGKKKGFFNRSPRVPTPDQFFQSPEPQQVSESRQTRPEPPPAPRPEAKPEVKPDIPMFSREIEYPTISKPEPITHPGAAAPESTFQISGERVLRPNFQAHRPAYQPPAPVDPPVMSKPEPAAYRPVPTPPPPPAPVIPFTPPAPAPIDPPVMSKPEPAAYRPAPAPAPTPAPAPAPAVSGKVTDTAAEAAQLEQEIRQSMGQETPPYQYPPLSLLKEGAGEIGGEALGELNANRQRLGDTIHSFGIDANIINVVRGPSVTRYELALEQGVKLNKLTNLADDIALALGATGVRIAPIPDKISVVGIEVPNKVVSPVSIRSVVGSDAFSGSRSKTSFAVGKDISGQAIIGDIGKLPHLLIAGTTGSGKSVCTNTIITSLLYKATPEEVRLIMVDPKMVELGIYNGIPHLLIPVVTDPKKAAGALQWAVTEMMKRYRTFSEVGVRKLEEYNAYAARTEGTDKMPAIVVLIDELADLMLVAAKEVEESICRVAQMGRAAGIHLVIATQRPSADVITGLMKANIPSRIAFAVASAMESRIILDTQGAEKLVGRGDMLFAPLGSGKPQRVQGCFISDSEVADVVSFVKQNSGAAQYDDAVMEEIEHNAAEKDKSSRGVGGSAPDDADNEYDELIDAAAEVVVETGQASVSMLQRRLKLGYARAARLVDQLEEKGIVGPFEGSKPRQLLVTREQWQEMKYRQGITTPEPPAAPAPVPPVFEEPPFDPGGMEEDDDPLDREEEETL